MPSRTTILILAGLLLALANGNPGSPGETRVLECMDSSSRGSAEIASKLEEGPDKAITVCCNYTKIISDCLAQPLQTSDTLLNFFRAYFYERSLLEQMTNLCPTRNLDNLKDLVTASEIMKDEGLTSIASVDAPAACAADIHRECLLETEKDWEKDLSQFALFNILIGCEKVEAENCKLMKHFNEINEAFNKHVSENQAALGKEMQHIQN